jgi:hypothetical protein
MSISAVFSQIQQVFSDPKSYEKVEEQKSESENEKLQRMFSLYQNFNNITYIKNVLSSVFTDIGFSVNFDTLPEYINYVNQKDEKNICNHFVSSTKLIESCDDTKPIPFDILMKSMECKTCGFYEQSHKVCSKYVHVHSGCKTCGQSEYVHQTCTSYSSKSYDSCEHCGRDLYAHREVAKKNGEKPCGNFVENAHSDKKDCQKCIFNRTEHFLNPMLFMMNKEAYNEFTDLAFKFQSKFIGLSDLQKYFYTDMFYSVLKMNYSKSHPSYLEFCNAEIPITPVRLVQITIV